MRTLYTILAFLSSSALLLDLLNTPVDWQTVAIDWVCFIYCLFKLNYEIEFEPLSKDEDDFYDSHY